MERRRIGLDLEIRISPICNIILQSRGYVIVRKIFPIRKAEKFPYRKIYVENSILVIEMATPIERVRYFGSDWKTKAREHQTTIRQYKLKDEDVKETEKWIAQTQRIF